MKKLNKLERRKYFFKKLKISLFIMFIMYIMIMFYYDFDKRINSATEEFIKLKSNSIISVTINTTIDNLLKTETLKSEDLYSTTFNERGELIKIDINTIKINEICNKIAVDTTNAFLLEEVAKIPIPLASLYNINLPNGIGPIINISILPIGNVEVLYETSFTQAGINQTNFNLWLNITSSIQLTSPVSKEIIVTTKKVPLISTIINGSVPEYVSNPLIY